MKMMKLLSIVFLGGLVLGCERGTSVEMESSGAGNGLSASDGRSGQASADAAAGDSVPMVKIEPGRQVNPADNVQPAMEVIWESDFEKVEKGGLSGEYLVLEGNYSVKEVKGNRVLFLPGTPLGTNGVMVASDTKQANMIQAKIYSTKTGRRYPTMGVGLRGIRGFRLYVSGARRTIEVTRGEQPVESVPYRWQSGKWVSLKLKMSQKGDLWVVEGKVWAESEEEPDTWMIRYETEEKPPNGRASLWGLPYSTKPILFDEVKAGTHGD